MIEFLKRFYWDMADRLERRLYVEYVFRNIPGQTGILLRRNLYQKFFLACGHSMSIQSGSYIIHPEKIRCGNHFQLGIHNYIQAGGGLCCGDNVMIGPYTKIWTQNHIIKDRNKPIRQQGYEYKGVQIGNDVWIGANAFIMPGTILGDGCVVSAGAVVAGKHYKEGIILAGNPARKIGER